MKLPEKLQNKVWHTPDGSIDSADLALVTAQNDLDNAGQELAKRTAERDQARADAERLREQVAPLADQVTCFNGLLEAEIGQLVREGQSDVGARLRKVLTRVATIGLKKPEGGT